MPRKSPPAFTVGTAPYADFGPALSRSITEASRAHGPVTVYVRDRAGDIVGYSEQDDHGVIRTVRR